MAVTTSPTTRWLMSRARKQEISSGYSEEHPIKNLWTVYPWNCPFNIFGPQETKTLDSKTTDKRGLLHKTLSYPGWVRHMLLYPFCRWTIQTSCSCSRGWIKLNYNSDSFYTEKDSLIFFPQCCPSGDSHKAKFLACICLVPTGDELYLATFIYFSI